MTLEYMKDAARTAQSLSDGKVSVTLALTAEGVRASARLAGTSLEMHRVVPYDLVDQARFGILEQAVRHVHHDLLNRPVVDLAREASQRFRNECTGEEVVVSGEALERFYDNRSPEDWRPL